MSVFSKIKSAKKAAKEHKQAENNTATETLPAAKVPYKHIPTHAAFDALSGAPSSWKHEDRPKIQQHNKRRSEMAISRSESTHTFSSPSSSSSSPGALPRNGSYNSYSSYNPTWNDRGGDHSFLQESTGKPNSKRPTRHSSYVGTPTNEPSRFINQENWPMQSSSGSTSSTSSFSSSHQLEIKRLQAQHKFDEKDIFTRLHTSTNRKIGEAPISDIPQYPVVAKSKHPESVMVEITKPKRAKFGFSKKTVEAPVTA